MWQKQPAAHPNPWVSLLPGHRARLSFSPTLVLKCGHATEFYSTEGKQEWYAPTTKIGSWKPTPHSSQCTISLLLDGMVSHNVSLETFVENDRTPSIWDHEWLLRKTTCAIVYMAGNHVSKIKKKKICCIRTIMSIISRVHIFLLI